MAIRKPIVQAAGSFQELPATDRLSPAAIIGQQKAIAAIPTAGSVTVPFSTPYAAKPTVEIALEDTSGLGYAYTKSFTFTTSGSGASLLYTGVKVTITANAAVTVAGISVLGVQTIPSGVFAHVLAHDSTVV